jgi:voltage-gated potassium channel
MRENYRRHLSLASLFFLTLVVFGTLGFLAVEDGWTVLDAFYTAAVTISTVGMQPKSLSAEGQMVAIILMFSSFGILSYLSFTIGTALLEGRPQNWLRQKRVNHMQNHVIVCGYGRTGSQVAGEISEAGLPVVVIEQDEARVKDAEEAGHVAVLGNATTDDGLHRAGIERARSLVAVLDSDPNNVFLVLTARHLNRDLYIVAVANDSEGEIQLRRVGVDRVVSLRTMASHRLSSAIIRPSAADFIELTSLSSQVSFDMDEAPLASGSSLIESDIKDSGIREKYEAMVVAIKRRNGDMIFSPMGTERFHEGDVLVLIGAREKLKEFRQVHSAINGAGG